MVGSDGRSSLGGGLSSCILLQNQSKMSQGQRRHKAPHPFCCFLVTIVITIEYEKEGSLPNR